MRGGLGHLQDSEYMYRFRVQQELEEGEQRREFLECHNLAFDQY